MATITVADLAITLDTDARTTRKFLRSITPRDAQPGKGSRWAIEKRDVRSLASKFKKWSIEQDEARKAREAKATPSTPTVETPALADDAIELDEGPSDAELAEIDAELEIED